MRSYRIFISHTWKYNEYDRILKFLDETENFSYRNYSIPAHKAVYGLSDRKLSDKIRSHIQLSQIILIPAGMEINYGRYLLFELEVAQEMRKPIIGIMPYRKKRKPKVISNAAWEIVSWRRESIVRAIEEYAL
jgi:hypothetical protein